MKNSKSVITSAVAGTIALCSLAGAPHAYAALDNMEKCAGIVKAGQNDCVTNQTACHGSVMVDNHPMAWIYLPTGTCHKIAGAHITHRLTPDARKAASDKQRPWFAHSWFKDKPWLERVVSW